jgi:hypothetical protein
VVPPPGNEAPSFEVIETSALRPVEMLNPAWTGWFVILQDVRDLGEAQARTPFWAERLNEPDRIETVAGSFEGGLRVLVTLGRFRTAAGAEAAATEYGESIPGEIRLLHVLPVEE